MRYQALKSITELRKNVSRGIRFQQGSISLEDHFTNYYSYSFDKTLVKFELYSSTVKLPLHKIVENKFNNLDKANFVVGINTNAFLMAEEGPTPKSWSYNLDILNGTPFQLSANTRPTIMTDKGKIKFKTLLAGGKIKIGGIYISWKGTHENNLSNDVIAYGNFNIPQFRREENGKKFISSDYDSSWINAKNGQLLIGLNQKNGSISVETITNKKLNLFDYLFILSGNQEDFSEINEQDMVDEVVIDNISFTKDMSGQSIISKLPREKDKVSEIFEKYLIKNPFFDPSAVEIFRKAWSVILETPKEIVFVVVDARPKVKGQEGMNIFELHSFLSSEFDFEEAFISDAGQSSKICSFDGKKKTIYGNLHYLDYRKEPPVWKGKDGRFVPGALLAYN